MTTKKTGKKTAGAKKTAKQKLPTPGVPKPKVAPVAPADAAQAQAQAAGPDISKVAPKTAIAHPENLTTPAHSISCQACGFVYAGKDYCPNCGGIPTAEQVAAAKKAEPGPVSKR